ncbi:hypothetical protein [Rickettsia sp. TH2014]|nr:hypothetical protein [Rickettsia sp. TH2014]
MSLATVNNFFNTDDLINDNMIKDVLTRCDINLLGNNPLIEESTI